jgi:hypothetical protein
MKKIFFLLSLIVLSFTFLFLSSCNGIIDDFSDMSKFKDSLQKVYPQEEINVKISNGTYLGVSFINSELKEIEEKKKQEVAKKIGKISRSFFKKERIIDGNLTFVTYKNYVIFKYTEAIGTYNLYTTKDLIE